MCWPSIGCSLLGHVFGITGPRLLGVPLQLGTEVIGMIGVVNKQKGYGREDGRLLSTFASQSRVHLSQNTVKSPIQEILRRLEARNRVQAAVRATKERWV